MTVYEANKKAKAISEEIDELFESMRVGCTSLRAEGVEKPKSDYDFGGIVQKIESKIQELSDLKNAINNFNNTHVLPSGITVGQALFEIAVRNRYLRYVKAMTKTQASKQRELSGVIYYEEANYDIADAKEVAKNTQATITKLQMEIDSANMANNL